MIRYGFDAPGIMLGMLGAGTVALGSGLWLSGRFGWWGFVPGIALAVCGAIGAALGLAMLGYGLHGKRVVRDLMLARVPWRGDEAVLDVGTGRGLLLAGAARRLTTGRATGIDIWRAEDLSGNGAQAARANLLAECVADRAVVEDGDIRATRFSDGSFDVVLSLLCLHNIEDAAERDQACREIARLLKPGGTVVIGDYVPTTAYARALAAAGVAVEGSGRFMPQALSPMWVLVGRK